MGWPLRPSPTAQPSVRAVGMRLSGGSALALMGLLAPQEAGLPGERIALRLGEITADRGDVPLKRVASLILARLRLLVSHGALVGLPGEFTLVLVVEASGTVSTAWVEPSGGEAGRRLATLARTWHMETW